MQMGSVEVEIRANLAPLQAGLVKAANESAAFSRKVEKSLQEATPAVAAMGRGFQQSGAMASSATRNVQNDLLNLRFQINDVATGLLSGASPFMVLSQQAGQFSQILDRQAGGIRGAVGMLGQAFMSMLNPINLAIAAIGVATYAATSFFSDSEDGVDSTEAALKRHEASIRRLKDAYGAAADGVKAYADESKTVLAALDQQTQETLRSVVRDAAAEAQGAIPGRGMFAFDMEELQGAVDLVDKFREAFRLLDAGVASGNPDIGEFRDIMAEIVRDTRVTEEQKKAAYWFLEVTEGAGQAARALEAYADAQAQVNASLPAVTPSDNPFGRVGSGGNVGRQPGVSPYAQAPALPRANPANDLTGDFGSETQDAYDDALKAAQDRTYAYQIEQGALSLTAESALRFRTEMEFLSRVSAEWSNLSEEQKAKLQEQAQALGEAAVQTERLRSAQQEAEREAKARESLIGGMDARLQRLEMERAALGMTEEAAASYRYEMEALLQAQQQGLTLTDADIARIHQTAEAMGKLETETSSLKDAQDKAEEAGKALGKSLEDVLMGIVEGGDAARDAIIRLAFELAKAALIGEGSLAGLFGKGLFGETGGGGGGATGGSSAGAGAGGGAANAASSVLNQFSGIGSGSAMGGGAAALAPGTGVEAQAWNYFAGKGLKPHQIAGIMGNIDAESGFNPNAVGDGGRAHGLFQHHPDRRMGIDGFLGDPTKQLDLAWSELQGSESGVLKRLLASNNVEEATAAFTGFERPQGWSLGNPEGSHNWTGRLAGAEEALAKFGQTAGSATENLGTLGSGFDAFGNALSGMGGAGGEGGGLGGILGLFTGLLGGLPKFAKGGISSGPAIFGEAGPEAAVPLPDGKSIPVKMKNAGRGGPTFNVGGATIRIEGNADQRTLVEMDRRLAAAHKGLMRQLDEREQGRWRN